MELDAIAVFVKVVQAGSFSKAAKLLGMPNTTVSAKVAALERKLGTTLIQRTTRKLHVTEAGESYFRRCAGALEEIRLAETELSAEAGEPKGLLRVTSPVDVGHIVLPHLVRVYLKRHPQVMVELIVTNRVVDLVAEGVDVALRAGALKDSTLIAKKLLASDMALYASPAFLKKSGPITHPRDVTRLESVRMTPFPHRGLTLMNGKEKAEIDLGGRISADDFETVKAFVLSGDGIALMPDFIARPEREKEKLIAVLPEWRFGSGWLSLVYPAQRFVSPKVKAFLKAAEETFSECPQD